MSSREQCQQLLDTIDAVLEECARDPRRVVPARRPRPAWRGPTWLRTQANGAGTTSAPVT